jgi:flagellar protein FlgJ
MMRRTVAAALAAAVVAGAELVAPVPAAAAAAAASVRVYGSSLNVRTNASTWNKRVGRLPDGSRIRVRCQLAGETIAGDVRKTALWLQIGDRRYVSDAYVAWRPRRPAVKWCNLPYDRAPRLHSNFIRWAAKHARASRRSYRVPVSVTIAQAINESGWGRSALTTDGNAYFGIKCFGTPGPIAAGCRPYDTHECDDDDCFATTGTFRVYRRAAHSFRDHGRFLTVNPRYDRAFRYTNNPNRFAREIHKAGYATDPRYSDKLIALMREYNLYRFDR